MKTSSAKAKGRRAQYWLRDRVRLYLTEHLWYAMPEDHILSRPMASPGEDLIISPAARTWFPFSPECKNQEKIGFWPTVKQAVTNCGQHIPMIFFMKNRTKPWIAIPAEDFFAILNLASNWADEYANSLQELIQED